MNKYLVLLVAAFFTVAVRANAGTPAEIGGIGITFQLDNGDVVVTSVTPGGSATAADIGTYDIIQAINGQNLAGMAPKDVQALLLGPAGTDVEVQVQHSGNAPQVPRVLRLKRLASMLAAPRSLGADSQDLVVEIALNRLPDSRIEASTNLPDGTQLQASLQPPLATCRPNCGYVWEANLTVAHRHFIIGPFRSGLTAGTYTLEITSSMAALQPKSVRALIGDNGEHLKGPFIKAELAPGVGPTVYLNASIGMVASDSQSSVPAPSVPANVHTSLTSTGRAEETPPYCVGFSAGACLRIRNVVESKIRPSYCVPGFARVDSGVNLSAEQLRICYAIPEPLSGEAQRSSDDWPAKQNQKIEDARAMVRDSWALYGRSIEQITIGFKCDVVDQTSANVAILQIQGSMQNELIRAGLIGDSTMNIDTATRTSVQVGKDAVQKGACTEMTPASRGRLRVLVSSLMP